MLSFIDTYNALHARLIDFSMQEYMFVAQVVLGEDVRVAYASVFDEKEFKKSVANDEEDEEYLNKFTHDAEVLLSQQSCVHLREYIEREYQSEVQAKASTLKDYRFTGADIQQLLANLLQNRVGDGNLDDASVKDVIQLIKSMYDSGALESSDTYSKHFITVPKKYDSLCTKCGHEFYAVEGLDCVCPNCGQVYKWSEIERRFYPQVEHL